MAVATITLESSAELSVTLNQRLTRGGVVAARVAAALPGTYWLAPRDAARRYIGFSALSGLIPFSVTPGNDNAPAGYWITPGTDPVEFGGVSQLPIVQDEWWVTITAATEFDIVVFRSV